MNKAQFLKEVRSILEGKLSPEELEDALSYYEGYFADSDEDEETVAERLGSPASVAEQVLKEAAERPQVSTPPPPKRNHSTLFLYILAGVTVLAGMLWLVSRQGWSIISSPKAALDSVLSPSVSPVPDIQDITLEPFDTLKLEVAVAVIQVKEGDSWRLRLVNEGLNLRDTAPYQLNYSQTDGTLSIWSSPDHFNLLPSHSDSDIRVELTVPSGTVLDRAELTLGVGSLDWQDCAVEGLLQAENGVGELDVSAPVGETELTTGVGDVSLEVMGEQADYAWQLDTGVGDIRLNGETTPPFTFTETGGQGKYTLSLSAGTGSVSLDFQ